MNKDELIKYYYEWQDRVNSYGFALGTISFERQTFAPDEGKAYSNKMSSILSGEYYKVVTDRDALAVLEALEKIEDLDFDLKIEVKQRLEEIRKTSCIPQAVFMAFEKLLGDSNVVWEKAKNANDFKMFEPYLIQVIESTKQMMAYRNVENVYEALLNDYESGMTIEKYDAFFDLVEAKISPLIKKINESNTTTYPFVMQEVAINLQESMSKHLLDYLQYSSKWGYMTTTEHPFSTKMSLGDCRITTKFSLNDFTDNLFSIIHEVGHATYNHQVDAKYEGRYVSSSMSSGMHESQSRLLENYLGRRCSFWKSNFKYFDIFPCMNNVSLDQFIGAINSVYSGFIRTTADELTYPVHILIRYKIEKGLFDGSISTEKLNETWNLMVKKYLGLDVKNDAQGILQDVHWSYGYFGYFPTYALGSAYAAQMMNKMNQELMVDDILESGNIRPILDWLKVNIHQYGGLYDADYILNKITNESFNPAYYIDYLVDKYSKIYNIK